MEYDLLRTPTFQSCLSGDESFSLKKKNWLCSSVTVKKKKSPLSRVCFNHRNRPPPFFLILVASRTELVSLQVANIKRAAARPNGKLQRIKIQGHFYQLDQSL